MRANHFEASNNDAAYYFSLTLGPHFSMQRAFMTIIVNAMVGEDAEKSRISIIGNLQVREANFARGKFYFCISSIIVFRTTFKLQ